MTPALLIQHVRQVLAHYEYVVVGEDCEINQAKRNPRFESQCGESAIAMFLLAVEPGAVLLCQGWSEEFGRALGLPLGAADIDANTGTWGVRAR